MSSLGVARMKDYKKHINNMTEKQKTEYLKESMEGLKSSPEEAPSPKSPTESQKRQIKTAKRIRSEKSRSPRPSRGGFSYFNSDIHQNGGRKTVRKVSIKNGKGHKTMTQYKKGKKLFTVKKPLTIVEIVTIQRGQFIPGLFSDCKGEDCNKK